MNAEGLQRKYKNYIERYAKLNYRLVNRQIEFNETPRKKRKKIRKS